MGYIKRHEPSTKTSETAFTLWEDSSVGRDILGTSKQYRPATHGRSSAETLEKFNIKRSQKG